MVGLVCGIMGLLVAVAVWVEGIDSMNKNYPDYKGEDLFGEDEEKEIHFEDVFNEEKKEDLKKFISDHKKNIKND
jgi:hypothetical protein